MTRGSTNAEELERGAKKRRAVVSAEAALAKYVISVEDYRQEIYLFSDKVLQEDLLMVALYFSISTIRNANNIRCKDRCWRAEDDRCNRLFDY